MNPLEFIYRWFISLYGDDLADYLAGWDCIEEAYIGNNIYLSIGIVTIAISLVFMVVYYYIINSASLNKWWHWIIVVLLVGATNLFIGYNWTVSELPNIGDCLMYQKDDQGEIIATLISETNCWYFGMANIFVSIMFFIIFSFVFKWGSDQCRRTPF